MSEQEIFVRWFGEAKREGLVDIKFFVENGEVLSAEDFCAAANALNSAIAAGDVKATSAAQIDAGLSFARPQWA